MKNPVKDKSPSKVPSRRYPPLWYRDKHRTLRGGDRGMDDYMMELKQLYQDRRPSADRSSDVPTQRTPREDFIVYGFRIVRTKNEKSRK
jgi:hypothetical protein